MTKKQKRKLMMLVLAVVFVIGAGLMVRQLLGYRQAEEAQRRADGVVEAAMNAYQLKPKQETVSVPQVTAPAETQPPQMVEGDVAVNAAWQAPLEENAQFLLELDYAELQAVNPDVMGWIHIPDSPVSYPLLRSRDNEDYLTRAWDGTPSDSGSIFLEQKNNTNFLDFNTILYGHHMANGTYFASVTRYKRQEWRDEHPLIYIVTDSGIRRYEVFASYEAPIDSDAYRLYYPDDTVKQAALDYFMESSVLRPEAAPTTGDYILTLSTCTGTGRYNTRWVVQAKLTGLWIR